MSLVSASSYHLVLASSSPRRFELLSRAGLRCLVVPSSVTEEHRQNEGPESLARRLAGEKARAVAEMKRADIRQLPILGADTIVVIGDRVLGKPKDAADARAMLELLSGETHTVITAYALIFPDGHETIDVARTRVTFKRLSTAEIENYLSREQWSDKAGAYAVQDGAAKMIRSIDGSYTNVVGLPLCEVIEALQKFVPAIREET